MTFQFDTRSELEFVNFVTHVFVIVSFKRGVFSTKVPEGHKLEFFRVQL